MANTISTNTLSVVLDITRSAVGRGTKDLKVPRTMDDIEQFQIVEQKVTAGASGVAVSFGPMTTVNALIVFTPKAVGLHLNGAVAATPVGSFAVLLDTEVTSLSIDNSGTEDVTVEIWLASLSD